MSADWFWEGNVQAAVADHLRADGWSIEWLSDTKRCQRGPDIVATKGERKVVVEAKGYPSETYADEARRGIKKKTKPTNQAPKWFSTALVQVIKVAGGEGSPEVAMAFPDYQRFWTFVAQSEWAL